MIIKGGTAGLAYLLVSMVIVPFVGRVHARMVYRSAARALAALLQLVQDSARSLAGRHRQIDRKRSRAGQYTGRILKGEKQSTCQFAGALVIGSPPTLLALNCVPVNRGKF